MSEASKSLLKVLLVEDSEDDAFLALDELRQGGYEPEWKRVETAEDMRQALSEATWDLILSDYRLPRLTGLDAFAIFVEDGPDIPFIIISGNMGEDLAVAAMKAGVHDYLTKGSLARLVPAVDRELREAEIRRDRRRAEESRGRAEQALRESDQRYRDLFESMQEAFVLAEIIVDSRGKPADWRYLDVNPAFEPMFGSDRGEVIGRTYRELFPAAPWEYWVAALGDVALTGKAAHLDHAGGERGRHYEAMAYSPRSGQFAAVFTDVTERKAVEERLRHAQKMESVGLLAGGVAHDFNNLLTVILGSASAGLEECPNCEHSNAIIAASERAAQLTKQLLAYAGQGHSIRKAFDISVLISGSRELLVASVPKRVDLVFNIAQGLPAVEEDPTRIEQILMNLVINAAEAIPPGTDGRIEVGTSTCEIRPEDALQRPRYEIAPGIYIVLEVRDNGCGMDEATLSQVFEPFFSTKFTGRGLGLAAVDGIVRSSGGFIDASSTPGVSTVFRVFLPASTKKPVTEFEVSRQLAQHRSLATILVVDDEELVRKVACMILRRRGYEVVEAVDGKDALRVLAASRLLPSLALVDLAMPVMGGEELVPILQEQYPRVKIVISSGFPEELTRNGFLSDFVSGFVQKPYTSVTLTDKIDEILGAGPRQNTTLVQFPKAISR